MIAFKNPSDNPRSKRRILLGAALLLMALPSGAWAAGRGDSDGDGDIDLKDFRNFQLCLPEPGDPPRSVIAASSISTAMKSSIWRTTKRCSIRCWAPG